MNLTALPTLQKISLLKIASRLCYIQPDESKERITDIIVQNVSSLGLPKILNQSLSSLIIPLMTEICSWIGYIHIIHREVGRFSSNMDCTCLTENVLQGSIQWQTVGLIDKEQTSLYLIRNESLDAAFRFVLACNCCFEIDILRLWQMFDDERQLMFVTSRFMFLPVVNYWTKRLETAKSLDYQFIPSPPFPCVYGYSREYLETMYSYYDMLPSRVTYYLFGTHGRNLQALQRLIYAEQRREEYRNRVTVGLVNVDNVAALKYFLQKCERMERRRLLEVVARNHFITNELLVFCLSQMSYDQLIVLIRSGRRNRVISCFVNSPWQERFWDFIDHFYNDLTFTEFYDLWSYIYNFKINGQWWDKDYAADLLKLEYRYQQLGGLIPQG